MSNFFVQELVLYRHFMLIDSPIPFELVANPINFRKDEHGNILNTDLSEITGRDICSRPAGAWRVDCWQLLPEQYHKQNPVFTMLIKYDRDLLDEGEIVDIRYSDIDIGEGVAGVNGQLVSIPADDFRPVVNAIESLGEKLDSHSDYLETISNNSDALRTDVTDISNDTRIMKGALGKYISGSLHSLSKLPVGRCYLWFSLGVYLVCGEFFCFGGGISYSIDALVSNEQLIERCFVYSDGIFVRVHGSTIVYSTSQFPNVRYFGWSFV